MLPRPVSVCAEGLSRLVTGFHLGQLHPTLAPSAAWRSDAEERAADVLTMNSFEELGWLERGRLNPEVATSVAVLCRPWVEYYGWVNDGADTVGILAASIGREALIAVREGAFVLLSHVRPTGLAEALVAQTPDVPPARQAAVEVLQSEALVGGRGPVSDQVEQVHRIAALPAIGSGELHVAVRDGIGRRHTAKHPLRYVDTADGRWLNYTTPVPGGDRRILVAPATRGDLAHHLLELRRTLSR